MQSGVKALERGLLRGPDVRKTVNLDPEAHRFAVGYAKGKGITMSVAITELIRRAAQSAELRNLKRNELGHLVFPGSGDVGTPEIVNEGSEDELV